VTRRHVDIALPAGYRRQDALAFHGRDAEGVAERVEGDTIRKGVLLDGVPVQLAIVFERVQDADRARCSIDAAADSALQRAEAALVNMLGLRIDPALFAAAVRDDPLFGPLVRQTPGLRVIQSATVFEALTWAIIGQQINLPFAIALRRSFIQQAGRPHPDGLWCYPEAADVARLDLEQLTSRKFSRAKAETLLRLARLVADGDLSLDMDAEGGLAATAARLLAIKGIGPWTVNYALLRGYGDPDCSLHGDVAVRSAIGRLLGMDAKPSIAAAEAFLQAYRPQRTMAAAYLWASLNQPAA
jgi:DNA-3-methyladenine glycosylase II